MSVSSLPGALKTSIISSSYTKNFGPSLAPLRLVRTLSISLRALILILVTVTGKSLFAAELDAYPGYLSDVTNERYQVAEEVVILPPQDDGTNTLSDKIFTEKITKEFQEKYEQKFGQTGAEQIFSMPTRFLEVEIKPGQYRTAEEEADEQKKFGSYMAKRLIEVHVDNYMKNNPAARPVYELKEKMSNLNVQVKPGYKAKFKYSLSSNDLDLSVENPMNISNKISYNMGSGDPILYLGYPISKKINLLSNYHLESNEYSLSGVRKLNAQWSTSLTGSNSITEGDKIIVGLSWQD